MSKSPITIIYCDTSLFTENSLGIGKQKWSALGGVKREAVREGK